MGKIEVHTGKTLKLTNVLCRSVDIKENDASIETQIEQMQTYIRAKGAKQIGPLIQWTKTTLDEQQNINIKAELMLQCNTNIRSVEQPYNMQNVIRIPNCLYCRYNGPEQSLKFAYDKLNLYAFENEIKVKLENYTVLVDRNDIEETIVADVFMECIDG